MSGLPSPVSRPLLRHRPSGRADLRSVARAARLAHGEFTQLSPISLLINLALWMLQYSCSDGYVVDALASCSRRSNRVTRSDVTGGVSERVGGSGVSLPHAPPLHRLPLPGLAHLPPALQEVSARHQCYCECDVRV